MCWLTMKCLAKCPFALITICIDFSILKHVWLKEVIDSLTFWVALYCNFAGRLLRCHGSVSVSLGCRMCFVKYVQICSGLKKEDSSVFDTRSQYVGEVIEQHTHDWVGRIRATKFNVFVRPGNILNHIWLAQGIVWLPDVLAWIFMLVSFYMPIRIER